MTIQREVTFWYDLFLERQTLYKIQENLTLIEMSSKRSLTRKTRRVMLLHENFANEKKIEQSGKSTSLVNEYNSNKSSVKTVEKTEGKIKIIDTLKGSVGVKSTFINRRNITIEKMEELLIVWIKDRSNSNVPLSSGMIRGKARNIYNQLKSEDAATSDESKFCASKGWFSRFKKRANLSNVKVGESGSADLETRENFRAQNCWMKFSEEETEKLCDINIETQIEEVIKLSNIISNERFMDIEEQEETFDHIGFQEDEFKYDNFNELQNSNNGIFPDGGENVWNKQTDITNDNIVQILKAAEFLKEKIVQEDPNFQRSAAINREIDSVMNSYINMKEAKHLNTLSTESINSIPTSEVHCNSDNFEHF